VLLQTAAWQRAKTYVAVNPNASDLLLERRWPDDYVIETIGRLVHDHGSSELLSFSSVSATAFAAVGFLIKPYFVLLPIGMLIARGIEQRSWRVFIEGNVIIFAFFSCLNPMPDLPSSPAWILAWCSALGFAC
jgi:hypothetical protein